MGAHEHHQGTPRKMQDARSLVTVPINVNLLDQATEAESLTNRERNQLAILLHMQMSIAAWRALRHLRRRGRSLSCVLQLGNSRRLLTQTFLGRWVWQQFLELLTKMRLRSGNGNCELRCCVGILISGHLFCLE